MLYDLISDFYEKSSDRHPKYIVLMGTYNENYCCPLKVSEQRDIHPQCCCNGIADDFSEGKPLS